MAVESSLRKEIPNGTVPLKEPSVPQNSKYERMGHSSVLLWHVGKRWEKGSCCKNGKRSSLSSLTPGQDLNGEVTKDPSHPGARPSPGRDLALRGAEHAAVPLAVLGRGWLRYLGSDFPQLLWNSQPCKSHFCCCWCVPCCAWTEREQKCSEGCSSIQWLLRDKAMGFATKMFLHLLGRTVHLITQHEHCLCVSGKPHGQAALLCLKRTSFSTSRGNLAEKLDPNSVLGGAVSTTDSGEASDSLCNKDIFPISKFLARARWNRIHWIDSNSQIYSELKVFFNVHFFHHNLKFFWLEKGKKEREFHLCSPSL